MAYWIKSRSKALRRNIDSKKQERQKQLFADFLKISALKNLQYSQENTCVVVSF